MKKKKRSKILLLLSICIGFTPVMKIRQGPFTRHMKRVL